MDSTGTTGQPTHPEDDRTDDHTVVQPPDLEVSAVLSNTPEHNPPADVDTHSPEQAGGSTSETQGPRASTSVDLPPPLPNPFGRYRVERLLGKGGMGAVYLALDTQLDRQVALKIPFFGQSDGSDIVDRFRREARSMATLHHPNLCPVYDVGEIGGIQFLSMAYVAGRSLAELLREGYQPGDLPLAALVEKLALALESAHRAGIIHRDLKPANILIRPDGEPVIMDFGLARRHKDGEAELTHSGMLLGTPAYMAPEQVEGRHDRVCAATDVYALGVILYQLLAGQAPFQGSVGSVLASIIHHVPAPPHEFRPQVNPLLESICLRAMAKPIEQRYASAGDLAQDLRRFQEGDSQLHAPVNQPAGGNAASAAEQMPAAVTRQDRGGATWRRLGMAAAGVALLAAVAAFGWSRREPPTGAGKGGAGPEPQVSAAETRVPVVGESPQVPAADPFLPRADAPDQSWRLPPEPRRYPSLHDTISHPPSWLIADRQAPFDLVQYFEVPVREDNAAPGYLKALFEFAPEVANCFPEATREAQMSVAHERRKRFMTLHDQWQVDRQSVSDDEFAPLLKEFDAGYELLRLAQRKRECVFEIGAGLDALVPYAQAVQVVARVEIHRARLALRQGQIEPVIDDVAMLLRLARDINNRGASILHRVACVIDGIVCDEVLRPILLHPQLTPAQCDRLLALLAEHDHRKDDILRQAICGEYITLRVMLHDFQYRTGAFTRPKLASFGITFAGGGEFPTPGAAIAEVLSTNQSSNQTQTFDKTRLAQQIDAMTDHDYDQEVAICDAGFQALLATCDRPVWQRLRMCSRIQDQFARNQSSRIVRYLDLPNQAVHVDRRNRAHLAGLIALTCLRRWQFEHPDPPASLDLLLATGAIAGLIPDPYGTGEPLRYVLQDGQPVIYSLAADETDDGGAKEWDLTPDGSGDMTFRLESLEALVRRRKGE